MRFRTRIQLLGRTVAWRLTWRRCDPLDGIRVPGNPRFVTPDEAAARIPDGAVVAMSGLGGNARASIVYWAVRRRFLRTGHPAGLTVVTAGGIGGRGRAPGTVEELAIRGLCTRFISGHLETFKGMLKLAESGDLELHTLPQGVVVRLLEGQGRGIASLVADTGTGTFLDPRTGRGSACQEGRRPGLIQVDGGHLRFTLPPVDVAIFNLPAADAKGNLYARGAAMIAECRELALAARRNRGTVIANVGRLVPEAPDEVFLPAEAVDAIVLHPRTEQTALAPHVRSWSMFTPESDLPAGEGLARARFVNRIVGITPKRSRLDEALARLAATRFTAETRPGAWANIGVGLPEEVCRVVQLSGQEDRVTFFTESGAVGGIPAPGIYFGAALSPERLVSSAEVFRLSRERLDVAVLGMLEADSEGNVNVSQRGPGLLQSVGPGGFMDFAEAAHTILFVGAWMAGGKLALRNGRVRILRKGRPKFVDRVGEITFSGTQALRAGKRVFYCTHVGVFQLTERGMELQEIMPGLDPLRDIVQAVPMRVLLPPAGRVPVVAAPVVTGLGFRLGGEGA